MLKVIFFPLKNWNFFFFLYSTGMGAQYSVGVRVKLQNDHSQTSWFSNNTGPIIILWSLTEHVSNFDLTCAYISVGLL
jgi:hypothetical protein